MKLKCGGVRNTVIRAPRLMLALSLRKRSIKLAWGEGDCRIVTFQKGGAIGQIISR